MPTPAGKQSLASVRGRVLGQDVDIDRLTAERLAASAPLDKLVDDDPSPGTCTTPVSMGHPVSASRHWSVLG